MNLVTDSINENIFISKLDNLGNLIWVKQIGSTSIDVGFSITVDDMNNIYTVGYFEDTVDFDPDIDSSNYISNGNLDLFILKLGENILNVTEFPSNKNHFFIYPNPTENTVFIKTSKEYKKMEVIIFDAYGRKICQNEYSFSNSLNVPIHGSTGCYMIQIKTEEGFLGTKLILKY